jgi:hypothetical protein
MRAQRRSLTGDLGWQVRVREERKKGEGREGADAWDQPGRGRKGERRECSGWERSGADMRARGGSEGEGRACSGWTALRELGLGAAHAGKGRKGEGRAGRGWAAWRGEGRGEWAAALFSFPFSFLFPFHPQTIQIILFEFK